MARDPRWYNRLPPSERELAEPDRRLDAFAGWILAQEDPRLARWAVEGLAGALGLPITVDPKHPASRAEQHGSLMVLALRETARLRPDLVEELAVQILEPHFRELESLVEEWREEPRPRFRQFGCNTMHSK